MQLNEQNEPDSRSERPWLTSLEWTYIKVRYPIMAGVTVVALVLVLLVAQYAQGAYARSIARSAIHEARQAVYKASPLIIEEDVKQLVLEAEQELESAEADYMDGAFTEARSRAETTTKIVERAMARAGERGLVSRPARFLRIEGEVRIRPTKALNWQRAAISSPLFPGDLIRTFSSSAAEILYEDGRITTMSSDSMLQILSINESKAAMHVKEFVGAGSVRVVASSSVAAASTHILEADAIDVRAMAREADLRVSVDGNGQGVAVEVYGGEVTLGSDKGGPPVESGTRTLISADGAILESTPMLPGPHLYSPAEAHLFWLKEPGKGAIPIAWSKVPGAETYEVEIGRHSLLASPEIRLDAHPTTTAKVQGLSPGWWFWRVLALDAHGIPGSPSPTGSFRIETSRPTPPPDRNQGPALEVSRVMQAGHVFILVGRTEPGARVTLDGGPPVIPENDGRFTAPLQIEDSGRHVLRIRATDVHGNESIVEREVYLLD